MNLSSAPATIGSEIDASVQTDQKPKEISRGSVSLDVKRAILFSFVFLFGFYLSILLIPLGKTTFLGDPDVYWHVEVGRTIWQTATFPHFDQLSHTFRGRPWIAKEWLAQLFLFSAYALDGWRGVALLTASIIALTHALLFLMLARSMRLTVAIGIATVAFLFSLGHFTSRPQIFADPLIVVWVASLVRAVENKSSPNLLLLPVMTLWSNIHPSFTFGLAIGAALALEAFFDSPKNEKFRTARRWTIFLVAAAGFACITPYGYQPFLATFQVFVGNEALRYIQEWRPATVGSLGINAPIIFGLLFLALYHGVKLRFWRLVCIIALTYLMFAHIRFGALFGIVAPLLLAGPLTRQFPFLRLTTQIATDYPFFETMSRISRRWVYPAYVLIAGGLVAFGVYGPAMAPDSEITPAGAVDYIYKEHVIGNIYNPHNFGGYLIFRGIKTFIDGRNDQLFFGDFTTKLHDIIEKDPTKFVAYVREYDVSVALVFPKSAEARELEHSVDWQKKYSDAISELYVKK